MHHSRQLYRDESRGVRRCGHSTRESRAAQLVTPVARMFFEPAVQYVGVHGVAAGQTCNGCAGLLAGCDQFGLEFTGVGPVSVPWRGFRNV